MSPDVLQSSHGPRSAVPNDMIWRLSVAQYHEMVRNGILTEDDPVELIEGWLVTKMPKKPPHRIATRQLRQSLEARVPPGWYADSQEPVTLANSEPEPDAMVVRGESNQYRERHPGGSDLALVVEVGDTTLERDRSTKKRAYAAAGIPTYWILNLIESQLEVYTDPSGPAEQPDYRRVEVFGPAEQVSLVVEGREVARIDVRDLLP